MKKVTRRTKRMIAIIVVYMIIISNVIAAYASNNTTYYFISVDENDKAVVKVYTPETEDNGSGTEESQEEQVAQNPEETVPDAIEVAETTENITEDTINTDPVEEVTDTEGADVPTETGDQQEPEASTDTSDDSAEPEVTEANEQTQTNAPEVPSDSGESKEESGSNNEGLNDGQDGLNADNNPNLGDENRPVAGELETIDESTTSTSLTGGPEDDDEQPVTDNADAEKQVLEEAKNNIDDLLEGIGKVDNFVIYADKYSTSMHIDGNIAVNEYSYEVEKEVVEWTWTQEKGVTSTSHVEKNDVLATINGTGDNYSYIGSAKSEGGLKIGTYDNQGTATNVATLVVGNDNITIGKDNVVNNNAHAEVICIDDIDLSNLDDPAEKEKAKAAFEEALKEQDRSGKIDAEKFLEEIQINKNLNEIAEQGEAAKEAVDRIWADENGNKKLTNVEASEVVAKQAIEIVNTLAEKEVKDAVIVFDVDVNALSDKEDHRLSKQIEELVRINKDIGATIVINMVIPEGNLNTEINFCVPINSGAYAEETAYVVWNFGNYNGNININSGANLTGIIVAPEATVVANEVINGRVVAESVSHNQEIHMPKPTPKPTPTEEPTPTPTEEPTPTPTEEPTPTPTEEPTPTPTEEPTPTPTEEPTATPTAAPTATPTAAPTATPTAAPTATPTAAPTATPTAAPTATPTAAPTATPTAAPTATPTAAPTATPTAAPTATPTAAPTATPTAAPTATPTAAPTATPTAAPTATPTAAPTATPTAAPTATPTAAPTATPTAAPTATPTAAPTATPTAAPTATPTAEPTPTATAEPTVTPEASTSPSAVPSTTPEASVSPSTTPGPDETPTPDTTPVPNEAPTPSTTPGDEPTPPPTPEDEPTPPPTPEEGSTPPPTPEEGSTPPPTPEEETTPEISVVTPAPEIPAAQVPTGTVLGARRIQESGTRAAVLGARRGSNYAVLGKRRRPSTGDSVALLVWILALAAAIGGTITSTIALNNSKKK